MTDFHQNLHAFNGRTTHPHIPPVPLWIGIVRAIQILFSILVLALAAYALSVLGSWSGFGLAIFTAIYTWIILAYILVTPIYAPHAYNVWAQLGLEIAAVIFWLSTFALLATVVSVFDWVDFDGYGYSYYGNWNGAVGASKAATAFGAFTWALFIVSLVTFGVFLHRHRVANGMTSAPAAGPTYSGSEEHKMNTVVNSQSVNPQYGQVPVQQQYAQAPVQQQYA